MTSGRNILLMLAVAFGGCQACFAHEGHEPGQEETIVGPRNWQELWIAWEFDPFVVVPLVVSAALYTGGLARFWRAAGMGHGIRVWEATCFWFGWLALIGALVSPLHRWGGMLFSAHMSQHEVLMLTAAPLMVLGKPLLAMLRALPASCSARLVRRFTGPPLRAFWTVLFSPFAAWVIHAVILSVWHVPRFFQATLTSDVVHALQHLSFFVSALIFWWAVMQGPRRAYNFGMATVYMFTTALYSGALGGLLTFAGVVWYPAYLDTAGYWGLTALEDQQLGGLIMWIPACMVYIVAGLALCAGSMRASEERVRRWQESAHVTFEIAR